jgi:RNA ligase
MTRWFTSDLHFGHRKVIEYCDRPYKNIEEMDEAIIKQWNSQVQPDDEVYFLGDFGINKKKVFDVDLISQLNGKKHIVLGNHDYGFVRCHKDGLKLLEINLKYAEAGWSIINYEMAIELKNGQKCVLTHLPPSDEYDNRYSNFKHKNLDGWIHLHGHLHGHYRKKGNMIDVCFDGNLKLLSEDDIIALIEDERDFIPTRLTEKYKSDMMSLMLMPFEEEVRNKNLRRVVRDDGKLVLYNYTDHCTYERNWNEITRVSRGIIFEKATGKIVAVPFSKFFNLQEREETALENLPNEKYTVTEKMDGSLGIIYNYEGKWSVATRGSFTSDQALRAQEILKKYDMSKVPENYTLLVEIVYPENKIVVDYGDREELVLLTVVNRDSQEELPLHRKTVCFQTGMPEVKTYHHSIEEMIQLQKTLPKDEEGFVVRFENGLRVKIKGEEYLRIHKLISQISPLAFWEAMENGQVKVDYLEDLPEEYREEADNIAQTLELQYIKVYIESRAQYWQAVYENKLNLGKDSHEQRKKLGLYIKNCQPKHGSTFFHLYNNDESAFQKYLMGQIRPKGNEYARL